MLVRSLVLVLGGAAFAAPFPEPHNNQAETIPVLTSAVPTAYANLRYWNPPSRPRRSPSEVSRRLLISLKSRLLIFSTFSGITRFWMGINGRLWVRPWSFSA